MKEAPDMNKPMLTLASLTTAVLLAGSALSPTAASASDRDDDRRVEKTGTCSDGARWKLEVKNDDGRLEVEGEVDSNRAGQTWRWKIKDNGKVAARGRATTGGRSGSFEVERKIANRAGSDRVVFKARHAGQKCRGVVTF